MFGLLKNFPGRAPKPDSYVNIVVFSDQLYAQERRDVVKLAIESVLLDSFSSTTEPSHSTTEPSKFDSTVTPLKDIFDSTQHLAQRCILYETVGLTEESTDGLEPHVALGNLHRFTTNLAGGVNLLIYVIADKPSVENYMLFYKYLCQEDAPIILVRTRPTSAPSTFPPECQSIPILVLDSKINTTLQNAIKKSNLQPRAIVPIDRFEQTAKQAWNLLEKQAKWDLKECRYALVTTLMKNGSFSRESAFAKMEEITDYIEKHYFLNVIVFGETGAGKTSVVEMLSGKPIKDGTGSSVVLSTKSNGSCKVDINDRHYLIHDTIGLNNVKDPKVALKDLNRLICDVRGGVSLLVYVHRDRMAAHKIKYYKHFQRAVCQGQVPTVLVQTGLEEENMDEWWRTNEREFKDQGIQTQYHACITSTKGKQKPDGYVYQKEYDTSAQRLKDVIYDATLPIPWKASLRS